MSPLIRVQCSGGRGPDLVYVSFDAGRSWLVVHPDGTTTVQYRTPVVPLAFSVCACNEE